MTVSAPSNLSYGKVVWQTVSDIEDGSDPDVLPDFIAPTGTVTFVASMIAGRDITATPNPVTVVRDPIVAVLDDQGYLCTPDPDDQSVAGARGLWLIATDDPDLNPADWVYNVVYAIKGKDGRAIPLRSHQIYVPTYTADPDNAVDLTSVGPVDNAATIGIPAAEAAAAAAVAAALAAEAALIDSSAFVNNEISTPGTPAELSIKAKIALAFKAQVGFNPKNYGAVGDGASATADKAGILAMMTDINAAVTAGVAGAKIVFPDGEFLLDDELLFRQFSGAIEGQGVGNSPTYGASPGHGTVIRWIGPSTKSMFKFRDYANVDIKGIRFEGFDTTPPKAIIESLSVSGDGAGTGSYLRIDKCALGKSTWSTQGINKGAAAVGVLFSGDNVNNDQFSIKDTQISGCAIGVSIPNTQSTWGVLDNVLITGSTTAGVKTSAALLMLNPQFDNCAIDVQVDSTAAVTAMGGGSERSGKIISLTGLGRVNWYGGKWLLQAPMTGSSDRFIEAPFLTANAGIYLYGVNITNTLASHPKLYGRATGGGGATGGFLVMRDCITSMVVGDLDVASVAANALTIDIRSSNLLVRSKYTTATTLTTSGDTYLDAKLDSSALDTDGSLTANSDAKVATQKATKTYVDQIIAAQDAMVFKGVIDCSANPNYPAADRGHTYRVSVAGKVGGGAGTVVEAGDLLICLTDSTAAGTQATVGANWAVVQTNLDGAVIGPAAATDGDFAFYNGPTGKILKDSGVSLDTDATMAGNSDARVPSQKAVKLYAQTVAAAQPARDLLTAGEVVPQRSEIISNGIGTATGNVYLTYWTADKTETINTLTVSTGSTAAAATPTLCRMGVFSVAANGDLTLVASTPNDTTLFAAANTPYAKGLSAPFSKIAGTRYATGIIIVSSATMPNFHGKQYAATSWVQTLSRLAPSFLGRLTAQTDLPSSITAGSLIGNQASIAMLLS